jgi:hypothetical protein
VKMSGSQDNGELVDDILSFICLFFKLFHF